VRAATVRIAAAIGLAGTIGIGAATSAAAQSRTLTFYHTHSNETATVTFRRGGSYDDAGLKQLNWLLRDWRTQEPTKMDPRLFDIIWEAQQETGSRAPIHIISAYRAPETNAMLRKRSKAVSEHSQHMQGRAMDIRIPDVPTEKLREVAMRLQRGGVGFYSSSAFVHVDTGSVRAWPRMTRDQLARLFPDGKTVHLPASGGPLPGYELAKAELQSRGTTVGGQSGSAYAEAGETGRRSLWAALFGGGDDSEPAQKPPAAATAYAPEAKPVLAAVAAPLPPSRPQGVGAAPIADTIRATGAIEAPSIEALSQEMKGPAHSDEQVAFRALFSSVGAGSDAKPATVRLALARTRPIPVDGADIDPPEKPLNVRFAPRAAGGELGVARFVGPAVKAVPVLPTQTASLQP
jgi:uncharacterized protein YcbK (DUF882 family)